MSQLAFRFWNENSRLPGARGSPFAAGTRSSDLWRTLVPTGPWAGVNQQRAATTNTKIFKTQRTEEEGGKSLNTENICASAPRGLIFPIPHILQILRYNSCVGGEEKKNNETWYFIKQIIYIDMKNWILFFFFLKKINITFVCFWKLFVFASLARRVSLPRSSPGWTVGPHPRSGSSAGQLLCVRVEGWDCKRVRRSKIAGRPFWKLFHSTYKLQGWQEVLIMCLVSFLFLFKNNFCLCKCLICLFFY